MEAGIGGQSSYHVGCILFSNIKNQKQNTDTKYRYKIQIQNTDTKLKLKLKNININEKQKTTNINYKLLMMIDYWHLRCTRNFEK